MKVYPIKDFKIQNKIELLLKATNLRNYTLYMVGVETGCRIGDIINLKVSDVKGSYISIKEQKTGKRKNIKVTSELRKVLKKFTSGMSDNAFLFSSRQNSKMSIRRVQQIFKDLASKLNIEQNFNSHSMRKTFAYNLYIDSNKNLELVMSALNHSSQSITIKYLGIDEDMIFNIMENRRKRQYA